jgi:hypothetical protein
MPFFRDDYLTGKLEWFNDFVLFSHPLNGGALEPKIGEYSEFFTKKDIRTFSEELAKVPPPKGNPQLNKEYENLSALVKLALQDPDLTLVLSQS